MNYELRITIYALAAVLWSVVGGRWSVAAGDFTPGYTFSDVDSDPNSLVTSNALWRLIGDGTLKTNAIVDRTEITVTATNDFLLIYDTSTNLLRKVSLNSLLPTNSVQSWQLATGAVGTAQIGTNFLRNLHFLTNWVDEVEVNTNWTVNTSTNGPGTNVFILIGTSVNVGTNGYPTNTVLRIAPLRSLTTSATFTNAVQAQITASAEAAFTGQTNLPAAGGLATLAHGLGVAPTRIVPRIVCVTNDATLDWVAGDEVNIDSWLANADETFGAWWADATNVYVRRGSVNTMQGINKTSGLRTSITAANFTNNFRLKIYARP